MAGKKPQKGEGEEEEVEDCIGRDLKDEKEERERELVEQAEDMEEVQDRLQTSAGESEVSAPKPPASKGKGSRKKRGK